jgi:type II secretory pathway component PulF
MYPMVLVCVAVIAVTLMLWMVVPTFAKMFHDMDAQLPAITQYVVDASNWIVKYGPYVLVGIIVAFFGFKRFQKTDAGRLYVGGLLMVLPSGRANDRNSVYQFASASSCSRAACR